MPVTHQITDFVVDLTFRPGVKCRSRMAEIQEWLEQELLQELDQLFSRYSSVHETLRFDIVELDCGEVTFSNYKQVLLQRLFDELDKVIKPQLFALNPVINFAVENDETREEKALQQFFIFVRSGQLPWHRTKGNGDFHQELFSRVERHQYLSGFLNQALSDADVRLRLVRQFPTAQLNLILMLLAPPLLPVVVAIQDLFELSKLGAWLGYFEREILHEKLWMALFQKALAGKTDDLDHTELSELLEPVFANFLKNSPELMIVLAATTANPGWMAAGKKHRDLAVVIGRFAVASQRSVHPASMSLNNPALNSVLLATSEISRESHALPQKLPLVSKKRDEKIEPWAVSNDAQYEAEYQGAISKKPHLKPISLQNLSSESLLSLSMQLSEGNVSPADLEGSVKSWLILLQTYTSAVLGYAPLVNADFFSAIHRHGSRALHPQLYYQNILVCLVMHATLDLEVLEVLDEPLDPAIARRLALVEVEDGFDAAVRSTQMPGVSARGSVGHMTMLPTPTILKTGVVAASSQDRFGNDEGVEQSLANPEPGATPRLLVTQLLVRPQLFPEELDVLTQLLQAILLEKHAKSLQGWMELFGDARFHHGLTTHIARPLLNSLILHVYSYGPTTVHVDPLALKAHTAPLVYVAECQASARIAGILPDTLDDDDNRARALIDSKPGSNQIQHVRQLLVRQKLAATEYQQLTQILNAILLETQAEPLREWLKLLTDASFAAGLTTHIARPLLNSLILHLYSHVPTAVHVDPLALKAHTAPLAYVAECQASARAAGMLPDTLNDDDNRARALIDSKPDSNQMQHVRQLLVWQKLAAIEHQQLTQILNAILLETQAEPLRELLKLLTDVSFASGLNWHLERQLLNRLILHIYSQVPGIVAIDPQALESHAMPLSYAAELQSEANRGLLQRTGLPQFMQLLIKASLTRQEEEQLREFCEDIIREQNSIRLREWLTVFADSSVQQGLIERVPGHFLGRLLQHLAMVEYLAAEKSVSLVLQVLGLLVADVHSPEIEKAKWQLILRRMLDTKKHDEDADQLHEIAEVLAAAAGLVDTHFFLQLVARRKATFLQDRLRRGIEPSPILNKFLEKEQKDIARSRSISLDNVGMVLLAPYLPRLFTMLKLTENAKFVDHEAAERSMLLLQFMVSGHSHAAEYQLLLNKILCGIAPGFPVRASIKVSTEEEERIEQLLLSVIKHWRILGSTTIAGLRESFLLRQGWLRQDDNAWYLEVKPSPFDMLLDQIPWNYTLVKFSWMDKPLYVSWRNNS